MTTVQLSDAQIRALEDFADPGGHGYGEFAYLSRSTAKSLKKLGLVELTSREISEGRRIPWGFATKEGREALRQIRRK